MWQFRPRALGAPFAFLLILPALPAAAEGGVAAGLSLVAQGGAHLRLQPPYGPSVEDIGGQIGGRWTSASGIYLQGAVSVGAQWIYLRLTQEPSEYSASGHPGVGLETAVGLVARPFPDLLLHAQVGFQVGFIHLRIFGPTGDPRDDGIRAVPALRFAAGPEVAITDHFFLLLDLGVYAGTLLRVSIEGRELWPAWLGFLIQPGLRIAL